MTAIALGERRAVDHKEHQRATSALKVLGIVMTRRKISEADPDWLLYDVRERYKELMKRLHPDKGGTTGEAQALNAAKCALERILGKRIRRGH